MMRNRQLQAAIFCLSMIGALTVSAGIADDSAVPRTFTDAEFQRLHKLLLPAPDEAWRTIPWKIALLDAQRNAVDDNKPIFIWAMDGHPLGCT